MDSLPDWARELLETERVGHLGLLDDDGRPRVLPVTFAVVGGAAGRSMYFYGAHEAITKPIERSEP